MFRQIHSYIQFAAAVHRETEQVGPFLATFTPSTDLAFLNYAVPDHDAVPTPEDIEALVDAYTARGRAPRLEYVGAAAPGVEPLLVDAGFSVTLRLPLMICTAATLNPSPMPKNIETVVATSHRDLAGVVAVTKAAYANDYSPPTEREVAGRRLLVARGGIALLARDQDSGAPSGSGICEVPNAGICELATVGVAPTFRRRGVAGAVVVRLCETAFDAGVDTVWLTPEHDYTERLYARLGFTTISESIVLSWGPST